MAIKAKRRTAAERMSPVSITSKGLGKAREKSSGLQFFNLSNEWGHGMPQWPSRPLLNLHVHSMHSLNGTFVNAYDGIMHRGTHMDAPIHVHENSGTITDYELWRFFGTGVAVSIPKKKWGVVTPKDLERANPKIRKNDIVMINTGSHRNWGDNPDYFAYSPGLYKEAAEWLVEKGVRLVGIDVQALDHPLGTVLASHGPGPIQPFLNDEYKAETGRDILDDFPYWEPAHNILMTNGIPGIENIGGDIDKVTGKRCTFFAFPWRWPNGEGCALRVVAVIDPKQQFRFETGR